MAARIYYNQLTEEYTLEEHDKDTGELNENIIPPKYSPEDKYAHYRRAAKKEKK